MHSQSKKIRVPYAKQCIDDSDIQAVVESLKSDFITQGPRIEHFERALAERTGADYAIAVSSGTAALHLAFAALGLKEGNVGLVPSITFAATANALVYCGAEPYFCDTNSDTGISEAEHFKQAVKELDENGRAAQVYVPVSLAGSVGNLEAIQSLASKRGAYVVEDAAHSLGAFHKGIRSGSCSHSDAAILSFHPVKLVTSGEGGAVLTNDAALARRVKNLRSHGIEKPDSLLISEGGWSYAQSELGWNYRMTDIQASLGYSQLKRLDQFLDRRKALVAVYQEAFAREPYRSCFQRPLDSPGSAWHLYVVRFKSSDSRRAAYDFLRSQGILAQIHYMPVYRHPFYKDSITQAREGAEAFYSGCLSLPLYPSLSVDEQSFVIDALGRFCQELRQS